MTENLKTLPPWSGVTVPQAIPGVAAQPPSRQMLMLQYMRQPRSMLTAPSLQTRGGCHHAWGVPLVRITSPPGQINCFWPDVGIVAILPRCLGVPNTASCVI